MPRATLIGRGNANQARWLGSATLPRNNAFPTPSPYQPTTTHCAKGVSHYVGKWRKNEKSEAQAAMQGAVVARHQRVWVIQNWLSFLNLSIQKNIHLTQFLRRRRSIRRLLSRIGGSDRGPQFESFRDCICVFECSNWVRRASRSSSNLSVVVVRV